MRRQGHGGTPQLAERVRMDRLPEKDAMTRTRTRWSKLRDNPTLPRTEQVARKHSCASQAQEKCTKSRSSLNENRTPLRKRTPVEEDELVEDTAQVDRSAKCSRGSILCLAGVPSTNRRISGWQGASRKPRCVRVPVLESRELVLPEMTGHQTTGTTLHTGICDTDTYKEEGNHH